MIEGIHNHLLKELEDCNRKEIALIILAGLLFLPELMGNSFIASNYEMNRYGFNHLLFLAAISLTILISLFLAFLIYHNYVERKKAISNLSTFYNENQVENYIKSVASSRSMVGTILYILLVLILGTVAFLIPLLESMMTLF